MSEISIRKKLIKAYAKAGKVLGRDFHLFRPFALDDALSAANFLRTQPAALTISKSFTDAQNESFQRYIVYTNHIDVAVGDILHDDQETFVIIWNRGLEDVIAVKATELVEVHRGTWQTTNGLQPVLTRIAKNVPASVTGVSSTSDQRLTAVQPTSQAKRWEVRIWATQADLLPTDNIKFANGVILRVDGVKVTEQCQVLTCTEV
jgi:hypothetical protein